MAYDSQSDRVILFGGFTTSDFIPLTDTWAYDFNTNTWTKMDTVVKPPGRWHHAMAYDSLSDRIILFGGFGGGVFLNDTWAYDFEANTWTKMDPGGALSARYGHAMAYDSGSDRVILLAGIGIGGFLLGDTWAYDLNTNSWTNMDPVVKPSSRIAHAMAYASQSDRVILFGGEDAVESIFNDTWAYDFNTNTWTKMDPGGALSARYGHAMAYDSGSDRVILFGSDFYSGNTWAYDFEANTWTNMMSASDPGARWGYAVAYDSGSDRVILFGGFYPAGYVAVLNDTWAYDFEANTWTPKIAAPSAPQGLQATPSDSRVNLTWSAPSPEGSSPIFGYRIYRGTVGLPTFLIEIAPVLSYGDTSVTEGTTYYYVVSAVNREGEGPHSSPV